MTFYGGRFPDTDTGKLERYYLFISGGCVLSHRRWILSGMKESVEVIAEEIAGIMTYGVGYLSDKGK